MTLAQVAKDVENGFFLTNEPVNIKIAGFDSFADFQMFFNRHYRPILERVRTGKPLTDKETHILHLLCDDMLAAIPEDEE